MSLKPSLALYSQLDDVTLKEGSREFRTSFPGYEVIRNVIAHIAEFSSTRKQKSTHSIIGPQKLLFGRIGIEINETDAINKFSDNLYDNSYVVSSNGKLYSYEVSATTVNKLQKIKLKIYYAFTKAAMITPLMPTSSDDSNGGSSIVRE